MKILDVQQAQLDYVATFEEPAFALWTDIPGMMGGVYRAFAGLHTGLTDFAVEGDQRDPLARKVVATLGGQGFVRVGYDRVEAVLPDYTAADLTGCARDWPGAVIDAHYLTFSIHAALREGTSVDYLLGLEPCASGDRRQSRHRTHLSRGVLRGRTAPPGRVSEHPRGGRCRRLG